MEKMTLEQARKILARDNKLELERYKMTLGLVKPIMTMIEPSPPENLMRPVENELFIGNYVIRGNTGADLENLLSKLSFISGYNSTYIKASEKDYYEEVYYRYNSGQIEKPVLRPVYTASDIENYKAEYDRYKTAYDAWSAENSVWLNYKKSLAEIEQKMADELDQAQRVLGTAKLCLDTYNKYLGLANNDPVIARSFLKVAFDESLIEEVLSEEAQSVDNVGAPA